MKTTIAGILTIVAGLANFLVNIFTGTPVDASSLTVLLAALAAGIGLIKAADATP